MLAVKNGPCQTRMWRSTFPPPPVSCTRKAACTQARRTSPREIQPRSPWNQLPQSSSNKQFTMTVYVPLVSASTCILLSSTNTDHLLWHYFADEHILFNFNISFTMVLVLRKDQLVRSEKKECCYTSYILSKPGSSESSSAWSLGMFATLYACSF